MKNLIMMLLIAALAGCASLGQSEQPVYMLGDAAAPGTGTKTIAITPNTTHVNVIGGETVNFQVGEKAFAWHFYVGAGVTSFDLKRVAPPGVLDHSVIAYVTADPKYCCGGNSGLGGHR